MINHHSPAFTILVARRKAVVASQERVSDDYHTPVSYRVNVVPMDAVDAINKTGIAADDTSAMCFGRIGETIDVRPGDVVKFSDGPFEDKSGTVRKADRHLLPFTQTQFLVELSEEPSGVFV